MQQTNWVSERWRSRHLTWHDVPQRLALSWLDLTWLCSTLIPVIGRFSDRTWAMKCNFHVHKSHRPIQRVKPRRSAFWLPWLISTYLSILYSKPITIPNAEHHRQVFGGFAFFTYTCKSNFGFIHNICGNVFLASRNELLVIPKRHIDVTPHKIKVTSICGNFLWVTNVLSFCSCGSRLKLSLIKTCMPSIEKL